MKKLITLLGTLVATSSTGSVLSNISNHDNNKITNLPKNDLKVNFSNTTITQQNTIYIDKNGKQQTTSEKDLSKLDTTEIIQIGFYKNADGQIYSVHMPKTIKKVPTQLPQEITSTWGMFADAESFNQDISTWNVSNVIDMSYMFQFALTFNQDLSKWNVSNVTNITGIFANAWSFNQNLSTWNVSNVTNMWAMFAGAEKFNQDLSKWNVSKVTNMSYMFKYALTFNQDLSTWNVSKVTSWKDFDTNSGITDPNKLPKFKK